MDQHWLSQLPIYGGLIGTAVTAVATIFLWRVTKVLARETQRLADSTSRPHVVVTIYPNRWSMMYADIGVANTGNATAYDIQASFDPSLLIEKKGEGAAPVPLQKVSVLKPGQMISSYLSEFSPLSGKTFTVTTSWRRDPHKAERESNTYTLSMCDLDGISQLGASDPLAQIAEEIKHMREDWRTIANGFKKLRVDTFDSSDRAHERQQLEEMRKNRQTKSKAAPNEPSSGSL